MSDEVAPAPARAPDTSTFRQGVLRGLLLHLFQLAFLVLGPAAIIALAAISLTQLLYMIPQIVIYLKRGQRNACKGIALVVGITVLLNATCFGIVMSGNFGR